MLQSRLAHYEIQEELGHGGMGVVYLARDTRLQRPVAIKVLPTGLSSDPERRSRLQREARAAAQLNHPNIATIYEVGEAETEELDGSTTSSLYIAMEYVEGQDLDQLLKNGEMPMSETMQLSLQISSGLEAAHQAGVVHRDLKPHNIRITPEGKAKILDFGLAKLVQGDSVLEEVSVADETLLTTEGMIVGTVPYMAPEQIEGKGVDSRCDLFSFGVVLYQMITGRLPFAGGNLVQFLKNLANTEPEPMSSSNPEVSRELEGIVGRLLAKDPDQRYQSASEVHSDLQLLSGDKAVPYAQPKTQVLRRRKAFELPAWLLWTSTLLLIIGILGAILWQGSNQHSGGPSTLSTLTVLPIAQSSTPSPQTADCQDIARLLRQELRDPGILLLDPLSLPEQDTTQGDTLFDLASQRNADVVMTTSCRQEGERLIIDLGISEVKTTTSLLSRGIEIKLGTEASEDLKNELVYQARRAMRTIQVTEESLAPGDRVFAARLLSSFYQGFYTLEHFEDPSDLAATIEAFEEIVEAAPSFSLAQAFLSQAILSRHGRSIDQGNVQTALAAARRAHTLDPDLIVANIAFARALNRSADGLAKSEEILRAAIARDPLDDRGHFELANTLRRQGDLDASILSYTRAIRQRPGYWRYFYQRALALDENGQREMAMADFKAADMRAEERNPAPKTGIAALALRSGDYLDAAQALDRISKKSGSAALSAMKGVSYYFARDWKQAELAYKEAISFNKRNPSPWASLGDCQEHLGKISQAQASHEEALALSQKRLEDEPESLKFLIWHSAYLAKTGRCATALEAASTHRRNLPPEADSELILALARPFALCDQTPIANEIIGIAVAAGMSVERISRETDFEDSMQADFKARLRDIEQARISAAT